MDKTKITVKLSEFDNSWFDPGGGIFKRFIWYWVNALLFDSCLLPLSGPKCFILRLFGASVGNNVTLKPSIRIKYPWHLKIGDNVWIGEGVWVDCLANVEIGNDVCISQDAYLLTGNHDYKDVKFGLVIGEIKIHDGAWLGARSITCPGTTVSRNAVLTAGSVLQKDAEANGIYRGNPAEYVRTREFSVDEK